MTGWSIRVRLDGFERQTFAIDDPLTEWSIGRRSTCSYIVNDATIAGQHATFTFANGRATYHDMRGNGGSRLLLADGASRRVQRRVLQSGDRIMIGELDGFLEFVREAPCFWLVDGYDVFPGTTRGITLRLDGHVHELRYDDGQIYDGRIRVEDGDEIAIGSRRFTLRVPDRVLSRATPDAQEVVKKICSATDAASLRAAIELAYAREVHDELNHGSTIREGAFPSVIPAPLLRRFEEERDRAAWAAAVLHTFAYGENALSFAMSGSSELEVDVSLLPATLHRLDLDVTGIVGSALSVRKLRIATATFAHENFPWASEIECDRGPVRFDAFLALTKLRLGGRDHDLSSCRARLLELDSPPSESMLASIANMPRLERLVLWPRAAHFGVDVSALTNPTLKEVEIHGSLVGALRPNVSVKRGEHIGAPPPFF